MVTEADQGAAHDVAVREAPQLGERGGFVDAGGHGGPRGVRLPVQQDRAGHRGLQHLVQVLVSEDLEHVALGIGVGADVTADERG